MTGRSSVRPRAQIRRRTPSVKRRSAGLTTVRAGALLAMVVAALAAYGLANSPVFGLARVSTTGTALTDDAAVRAALDVPRGANLVTLDTALLATRLEALPTVRSAAVSAALPDTLQIRVAERRPILAWAVGERRFLVDVEGRLIAELAPDDELPRLAPDGSIATRSAGASVGSMSPKGSPLPLLTDRRSSGLTLEVGDRLTTILLDAARRIGSVEPSDVGSAMGGLVVSVDDEDGFVLRPAKGGWVAVFGFYTPSLRSPELIPGQVRLLRSLLAAREDEVARIVLASGTDGTYVPRLSPSPSPSPKP